MTTSTAESVSNDTSQEQPGSKKPAKAYVNQLYANDSLTTASGFINEIRPYDKEGRTLYFISVGIIQGSVKEGEDYKGDITNCDLLAGSTLEKWASGLLNAKEALKGVRLNMEIRNLKFIPKLHEGKAFLDSRGILETVKFGSISV